MRTPLYLQAQQRLRDYIVANDLEPGSPLPSEADLASALGISRLSLREATKSLETVGVINAQPGRGLFVSDFSFRPILDQLPYAQRVDDRSLTELLQVREAMEAGLIAAVAQGITADDLAELDAVVDRMAQAQSRGESTAKADRDFHVRLYRGLSNSLVTSLIELFWDLFHRLEADLPPGDQHAVELHRTILTAVRSGDPERMQAAVSEHFDGIRQTLHGRTARPVSSTREHP